MATSKDGPGSLTPLPSPPAAAAAATHDSPTREAQASHIATPSSLSKTRNVLAPDSEPGEMEDLDSDHLDSDEVMEEDPDVTSMDGPGDDHKVSVPNDATPTRVTRSGGAGGGASNWLSFGGGGAGPSKGGRGGRGGNKSGGGGPGGKDKNENLTMSGEKILDRDYAKLTFDPFYELLHPEKKKTVEVPPETEAPSTSAAAETGPSTTV